MALDELLASQLAETNRPGYLRFYQWQPATLSFGYNQKIERTIDQALLKKAGIDMVRRMSGGRMVFHNDEYTFCTGFPVKFIENRIGRGKTFLDMFIFTIRPLVEGLNEMGIPARFAAAREMRHSSNDVHCYATAAGHSIYVGDKKLVGAAGVIRQGCLIVHGSLPVKVSFPPEDCFIGSRNIDQDVNMAAIEDFCKSEQIGRLPKLIAQSFVKVLDLDMIDQPLSELELTMAEQLATSKYSDLNWNLRKNMRKSSA